uniref:E2 ubiquitin-conjugating enzyme n=1 Tax=Ananas comosus var. bracteatus TaxID=296719 RepID=A0A6V7QYF4_ANACO
MLILQCSREAAYQIPQPTRDLSSPHCSDPFLGFPLAFLFVEILGYGRDAGRVEGSEGARGVQPRPGDLRVGIALCDGGSDLSHLTGTISGPVATPYEGGTFRIDIRLPGGYPFEPPKMQFITKVWHPNISSQNGAICLDILKDQWSPALTLKTALLSVQALLSSPEPDDPQDAVVAQQYLRDHQTFIATARYWTETFAKRISVDIEEKVQKLVEMGFPEDLVRSTLKSVNGDENMALEKLCSS